MDFKHAFRALTAFTSRRPSAPIPVEEIDTEDEEILSLEPGEEFPAEGQCFMIEYRSADGEFTRRRIVARTIRISEAGAPLIGADCLMRKEYRSFRADRIESCIDLDGEVHEPAGFLIDNLGLDIRKYRAEALADSWRLKQMRATSGDHATILAALSRCDSYMHPSEVSVAAMHCEQLCDRIGPNLEECNQLIQRFQRLRPSDAVVAAALERVLSDHPDRTRALLVSGARLVRADGIVTPEEATTFNAFSTELIGAPVL
jgi:hypothetical protein